MNAMKKLITTVLIIAFIVLISSMFTVYQSHKAIIQRLGKLVTSQDGQVLVLGPGLHLKWPFLDTARVFDTRIQTLDIKSSRIVTVEKKDVIVDYYVKWQIENLPLYFRTTSGNSYKAERLLEQQLNTLLRAQFGKRKISDLVSVERGEIMKILLDGAEAQATGLGVHVVDVRIKGIELPSSTISAIYDRMRAIMRKIADSHRADGKAESEKIRSTADREATVTIAKAQSEGLMLEASGRAEAATIYANAFSKDKTFFNFYRSMLAYGQSFNSKQDILVLDQSNAFFDYFKKPMSNNNGKKQ